MELNKKITNAPVITSAKIPPKILRNIFTVFTLLKVFHTNIRTILVCFWYNYNTKCFFYQLFTISLPGTPTTTFLCPIDFKITSPAQIFTSSPIRIGPKILAPQPSITRFPNIWVSFVFIFSRST